MFWNFVWYGFHPLFRALCWALSVWKCMFFSDQLSWFNLIICSSLLPFFLYFFWKFYYTDLLRPYSDFLIFLLVFHISIFLLSFLGDFLSLSPKSPLELLIFSIFFQFLRFFFPNCPLLYTVLFLFLWYLFISLKILMVECLFLFCFLITFSICPIFSSLLVFNLFVMISLSYMWFSPHVCLVVLGFLLMFKSGG